MSDLEIKKLETKFQSTLPAGEATLPPAAQTQGDIFQSTLPAGEATVAMAKPPRVVRFQSTLPAGEATDIKWYPASQCGYFNPRFPRGKRP